MANGETLFKTGDQCATPGKYVFVSYVDNTQTPQPDQADRVITVRRGETFPTVKGGSKPTCWKLLREES